MSSFCLGSILLVAGIIALVRITTLQRLIQNLSKEVESLKLELAAFKREVRGRGTVEPEATDLPPPVVAAPAMVVPQAVIPPPPVAPSPAAAPPTVVPPIAAREVTAP